MGKWGNGECCLGYVWIYDVWRNAVYYTPALEISIASGAKEISRMGAPTISGVLVHG